MSSLGSLPLNGKRIEHFVSHDAIERSSENPFWFPREEREITGIVTSPFQEPLFLLILVPPTRSYRIGPGRLYVSMSRWLAEKGIQSIRADFDSKKLHLINWDAPESELAEQLTNFYHAFLDDVKSYIEISPEKIFLGFSVSATPLITYEHKLEKLILISPNILFLPDTLYCKYLLVIYGQHEKDLDGKLERWRKVVMKNPRLNYTEVVIPRAEHHFYSWESKVQIGNVVADWLIRLG